MNPCGTQRRSDGWSLQFAQALRIERDRGGGGGGSSQQRQGLRAHCARGADEQQFLEALWSPKGIGAVEQIEQLGGIQAQRSAQGLRQPRA